MMFVEKEKGFQKMVQTLGEQHLLATPPPQLCCGADPHVLHTFPELECFRDVVFLFKSPQPLLGF